jgi:pyruvate ferredoxin oxidoreductase gamma subunit
MLLRIRFHGRGGHGVKTAARIDSAAAFQSGNQAQDSPMYGAERRGAAVTAAVRISDQPILQRGPVAAPDLIVLADQTLLRDASAGVLRGQEGAAAIFINQPEALAVPTQCDIRPRIIAWDISGLTREILGRASALSAALAGAAARLTGLISRDNLLVATREELEELEVTTAEIDKNIEIAGRIFDALVPVQFAAARPQEVQMLFAPTYQPPLLAAPSILHAGNAVLRQTGAWRVERPVVNRDACTRCGYCFVMCPEGVVQLDHDGYPVIDYDHCKGCMICQRLCPLHAIGREQETQAW